MTVNTMLKVTAVSCVGPAALRVAFDDGSEKAVDLAPEFLHRQGTDAG